MFVWKTVSTSKEQEQNSKMASWDEYKWTSASHKVPSFENN